MNRTGCLTSRNRLTGWTSWWDRWYFRLYYLRICWCGCGTRITRV